jgi:outer membrane protein TolC
MSRQRTSAARGDQLCAVGESARRRRGNRRRGVPRFADVKPPARRGSWSCGALATAPIAAVVAIAGCVSSSQELRAPVDRLVAERMAGGPGGASGAKPDRTAELTTDATDAQIDALLAAPLDTATAIRIALVRNPGLRVAFDALDVAAADVAGALGFGPVEVDAKLKYGSAHNEVEVDAIQGLLGVITAPGRRAAASAELSAARATAAAGALRLAARVEIAIDDVRAAQQEVALRDTAYAAADAAATLRERMHAAGNTSDLALARERDGREQARLERTRAEAALVARRDAAAAMIGLSGRRTEWTAAGELRALPDAPPALDGIAAGAVAASLELAAARDRRDAADHRAGTERLRSVLPEIGAGVAIADDGHNTGIGPAVRIGVPLFDPRSGERARANALVRRADHELEATRAALAAGVRAARQAALAAHAEAHHLRTVVLPLRQQIIDETLKHYNAMDADPFALIAARQGAVDAAHQYLDAQRRYWSAMAEVAALGRGAMLRAAPEPSESAETGGGMP